MRIPFTSLDVVWHRVGEPADRIRPAITDVDGGVPWNGHAGHSGHSSETACTRKLEICQDGLPFKIRSAEAADVAVRLRSQFIARATRSHARIVQGEPLGSRVRQYDNPRPTRTVEAAARETLRDIRLALYDRRFGALKSNNKREASQPAPIHAQALHARFHHVIAAPVVNAARSASIWQARTVNCNELASAAQDLLAHRHPKLPTSLVVVGRAHALAVIGAIDAAVAARPMATWPSHLQVCDPWANLTCRACDYPRLFSEKMRRWASQGKLIRHAEQDWRAADDPAWMDIVHQVPEVFSRRTYRNGQFMDVPVHLASGRPV